MTPPKTLRDHAGIAWPAAGFDDAVLLLIDAQREYTDGKLRLHGIDAAVEAVAGLLDRARRAGTPIVHVAQNGRPGSALFDPEGPMSRFIAGIGPGAGEATIVKSLPNAFAKTDLDATLKATGRTNLIVAGFMTHMCISATTRVATDLGYRATVIAGATATRDLPDGNGGVIDAATVQRVALAELGDRFATVVPRL
ncbi:cysteine hydrolase family protein [Dongia sedimenti]|uniref:Cysteine hydrolase family protein n=1 Tax=Dongia sedimenti TaxID=3064282 RepID=A0ABU0YJH8_9PROT|nr:cysteine hydrolase family protein [Rhodospirillaceae bacterium R-7]